MHFQSTQRQSSSKGYNTIEHTTVCSIFDKGYRFGFNGQEKDNEVAQNGSVNTAEFWEYDTRIGRRWNIDPYESLAPDWTPFRSFFCNPIYWADPNGLFESRKEAKEYKKANNLKGKIKQNEDGTYTLHDKSTHINYTKGDDSSPGLIFDTKKGDGVRETYSGRAPKKQTDTKKSANTSNSSGGFGLLNSSFNNNDGIKFKEVNDALAILGYVDGAVGATQLGMTSFRQSMSINSKIGTFGNFRIAYKSLGAFSKVAGRVGQVAAPVSIYFDYQAMEDGEIGPARFSFRTLGTLSSLGYGTVVGFEVGGPAGALAGAGVATTFWSTEKLYDGYEYGATAISIFSVDFTNAINGGWCP